MTLINPPKQVCGAKIRQGGRCREVPAEGKKRCRIHGGAEGSGAPAGERNGRFKHGLYSAETRAQRLAEAAQRRTAADEWLAKIPTWEWHATCAEIERSAAARRSGEGDLVPEMAKPIRDQADLEKAHAIVCQEERTVTALGVDDRRGKPRADHVRVIG